MRRPSLASAKRPTTVRIRQDLLVAARRADLDLSALFERALVEELAAAEQRLKWRDKDREAIRAYDSRVQVHGRYSRNARGF
jgi:post-segregation antitoxin (ccd killing protein)